MKSDAERFMVSPLLSSLTSQRVNGGTWPKRRRTVLIIANHVAAGSSAGEITLSFRSPYARPQLMICPGCLQAYTAASQAFPNVR